MSTKARIWLAGLGLFALSMGLFVVGRTSAGEEAAIKAAVTKIAAAIEKGDNASAKALATALAKKVDEIDDVMNVFKPRTKKGFGVGNKPGLIQPDGIELKLVDMGRDAPPQAKANKEAAALEEMAYRIAAVAEVALIKPPKDVGKKKADWVRWAKDMRAAAPGLAAAAKSKSPAELQKAAAKLNAACNSCHSAFK
jgi:hypothetical protein